MNHNFIQFIKLIIGFLDKTITQHRMLCIIGSHLGFVILANILSFLLRFEGTIPNHYQTRLIQWLPILIALYMASLWSFGLFHGLWRYVGFHDLFRIFWACVVASLGFYLFIFFGLQVTQYPRSTIILTGLLSTGFLSAVRLTVRWFREWAQNIGVEGGHRVLIVGAGNAGELLLRDMQCNVSHNYVPVAFVDDAPHKLKKRIHGIPIAGHIQDISKVCDQYQVQEIIIAMPSASPLDRQKILLACEPCPIPIKTLPNIKEILRCPLSFQGVHTFTLEDLLQREPVRTDLAELKPLLHEKRILVTGAGGSIGSELCRQISLYSPSQLVLLERHENSLYSLDLELQEKFPHLCIVPAVGDTTDHQRVDEIFSMYAPQLVFHTAAHKHVPLMESNAIEALRNNVYGTKVVSESASRYGTEQFVLISTDKAINPTSVMGASKWLAERLIQSFNGNSPCNFSIVRFGNVLGSNGSVVPLFSKQIRKGGPVTVTHPDIKRYFMTIPEAVQLCLQASSLEQGGDIFVLDMGEQIPVLDLARNMIRLSGYVPNQDIKIIFSGLRPGEKLYEELTGNDEILEPTHHRKIQKVQSTLPRTINPVNDPLKTLNDLLALRESEQLVKKLQDIVPGYTTTSSHLTPNTD